MEKLETYLLENTKEFVGFARKRFGDPEPAVDAVQDTMLKALKAAKQIHDEEKAKALFYKILRRTIIDLHRRRDAREHAHTGLEHELNRPPDSEEERVVCVCLERLLPAMTTQYAELIRRIDLNQESPEELVASLGISKNNLNVRLHRARQQLKQRLEENCRVCAKHGCLDCDCAQSSEPHRDQSM
jgi:RNA polymerase sigma factor (sigma-70 family)